MLIKFRATLRLNISVSTSNKKILRKKIINAYMIKHIHQYTGKEKIFIGRKYKNTNKNDCCLGFKVSHQLLLLHEVGGGEPWWLSGWQSRAVVLNWGDFVSQATFGNVWRYFLLSWLVGRKCNWHLGMPQRMLLNTLQWTQWAPQQSIIWSELSVLRLMELGLENVWSLQCSWAVTSDPLLRVMCLDEKGSSQFCWVLVWRGSSLREPKLVFLHLYPISGEPWPPAHFSGV